MDASHDSAGEAEESTISDGDLDDEPLPPWVASARAASSREAREVPTLQTIVCHVLAEHLHCLESLEYLPDHLASIVRGAVQRDRRLLSDDSLAVWLESASRGGTATKLDLRWASSISDQGMNVIAAADPSWTHSIVELDLSFCEALTDAGVQAFAPSVPSLRALVLSGCVKCGDGACKAIGHHCSLLERCELELLQRTTDLGVQALVRGCPGLSDLRLGGCAKLSNISTSLIADHCTGTMCRLGLGGLSTLNDVDLEDVGKITSLTWLDLCACPKVSDAGIKQVGLLAAKQMKAHALWEEKWGGGGGGGVHANDASPSAAESASAGTASTAAPVRSGVGSGTSAARCLRSVSSSDVGALGTGTSTSSSRPPPPPTIRHLDLGGLARLSDTGLQKLLQRTKHLTSLDLRGCSRLTEDGLATALASCDGNGARVAGVQLVPMLERLTLLALDAASERVVTRIESARPGLKLVR